MSDKPESIDSTAAKKPYVKPQVKRVALKPDEAVLGSCKMATLSGPAQKKCSAPASCSSIGS
jgi:hypothetical protein